MEREKINNYLLNEKDTKSEVVRKMLIDKVTKYDDIAADFAIWLEKRNYDDCKVEINHWTAQRIYNEAPFLDGIGVFNFLVTLRDDPEDAAKIIEEGFIVR